MAKQEVTLPPRVIPQLGLAAKMVVAALASGGSVRHLEVATRKLAACGTNARCSRCIVTSTPKFGNAS